MSIQTQFLKVYGYNLEQKNNEYILSNPNIKNSLIIFFKYYDNQYYNSIDNSLSTKNILIKYFEHLDLKQIKINSFINSFKEEEIQKLKVFYYTPNAINFTELGQLHNLLFWFSFYKKNNLGNIDLFIEQLKTIEDFSELEKKFYALGFFNNPKIDYNFTKLPNSDFEKTYPEFFNLFFNLFDNLESITNKLDEENYLNLIFLFNVFESKIILINHYYKIENQHTFLPLVKTFMAIEHNLKNNT
jgi:hypothetical protein